ncbi:hypothetical protein WJX74_007283 [Apatococcus lobatus]|uniref:Uncharacterized protein n=1 Tax=Apatococcus lobatus TaxID=904363 RepID=A0AAW1RD29_9CHLO
MLQVSLLEGIPAPFAALSQLQHLSVSWDHGEDDLYHASSAASKLGPNTTQLESQPHRLSARHRFRLLHRSKSNSALAPSVAVLLQLRSLQSLHLAHPAFSDADLRQVGSLTRLTELVFMQSAPEPSISSEGLMHLSGLTGLRWLDLVASERLEETALIHLQPLRQLHFLDIGPFISLSDLALNTLQSLQLLQRICLRICRQEMFLQKSATTCITNRGMVQFADCHPLAAHLCLGNDQVMSFPSVSRVEPAHDPYQVQKSQRVL